MGWLIFLFGKQTHEPGQKYTGNLWSMHFIVAFEHMCSLHISSSMTEMGCYSHNSTVVGNQHQSHKENMSVKCIPPHTPLLYSKTGVYRGIPIFLIFAPKHRLWVLVRTASPRLFASKHRLWVHVRPPRRGGSNVYPQFMLCAKIRKISKFF